jgi:alpha-glucosidase (family GH31 glycosyl hydrolase)
VHLQAAQLDFTCNAAPFSFNISRARTGEVLFTTASHPLIFKPQSLRVKMTLSAAANIYGLGEHSEPFRLDPANTTRTLWARDTYGIPRGTNLYGSHPCTLSTVPAARTPCCCSARQGWTSNTATTSRRPGHHARVQRHRWRARRLLFGGQRDRPG